MHTKKSQAFSLESFISNLTLLWQIDGHSFDYGKQLQLQQLLQRTSGDKPLTALKPLLAPAFADNVEDRKTFYQLFDDALAYTEKEFGEIKALSLTALAKRLGQSLWQPFNRMQQSTLA